MRKSSNNNQQAFTLIELLIVIVIIGVLAGVLIAVINPFRQQNRARNAATRAAVQKVAFAVNTTRAGLGKLPSSAELDAELENITPISGECSEASPSTTTLECYFKVSGVSLPETCTGADSIGGHSDTGTLCRFGLESTGSSLMDGAFRLTAKKFKLDPADLPEIYIFDSQNGLYESGTGVSWTSVNVLTDASCSEVTE